MAANIEWRFDGYMDKTQKWGGLTVIEGGIELIVAEHRAWLREGQIASGIPAIRAYE
jgi:hypothetical protein